MGRQQCGERRREAGRKGVGKIGGNKSYEYIEEFLKDLLGKFYCLIFLPNYHKLKLKTQRHLL